MDDLTNAQFSLKDDILMDIDHTIRVIQNSKDDLDKVVDMLIDIEKQVKEL